MLQTTRSKFSNRQISASCSLCGSEDEDNIHFILNCPDLASTRKYYIDELKSMLYEIDHDVSVNIVNNDELFIQLILDETSPCIPMVFQSSTALCNIEALTRGFCFALHKERGRRMDIMVRKEGTVCLGLLSDIYKDVGEWT